MASGGAYDGWWNGGIRNTGNFHNIIAILTETIGSPTPMRIPLVIERQIPNRDLPYPIAPQEWHFRQSVDYSISFNRAVIDYASRNREHLLYNIYEMGQRAIERGSQDTWTPSPTRLRAIAEKAGGGGRGGSPEREPSSGPSCGSRSCAIRAATSSRPISRTSSTAIKFVNALREVNVAVQRATREFSVAGKSYPAGSFVVMTAQAFRPHVIDMFEPQDHPNVIPYPGAPPTPPYDNAGWTLAFQMGVAVRSRPRAFTGPFETRHRLERHAASRPGHGCSGARALSTIGASTTRYRAVNRLLAAGGVGQHDATESFYVGASPRDRRARCRSWRPTSASVPRRRQPRAASPGHPRAPHWLVGSVRRLDGIGLDALDPRAVRVPVRARVRAEARCRQPERGVRRAHLPERWDPGRAGGGRGGRGADEARGRRRATSRRSTGRSSAA